jgi:hypothetical protein
LKQLFINWAIYKHSFFKKTSLKHVNVGSLKLLRCFNHNSVRKVCCIMFRSACKGVVNSPRHRGCHKYVKTQSFHMDYFHVRCGLNFGLRWLGHMIPRYIWHIESIYTWMLYSWRADSIYIYIYIIYIYRCILPRHANKCFCMYMNVFDVGISSGSPNAIDAIASH